MYVVTAVYPSGHVVLVGFIHTQEDLDMMMADVYAANGGKEALEARGIRFCVEFAA